MTGQPQGGTPAALNPWRAMWLHPRRTLRGILSTNPRHFVLLLVLAAGIGTVCMQGLRFWWPAYQAGALVLAVSAGVVLGVVRLYFFGWWYRWIGSWLGGSAKAIEVRAAIAWAGLPTVGLFGLWAVLAVLSPEATVTGGVVTSGVPVGFLLVSVVLWIWQAALSCHALGEAHQFSSWKGLGTLVISNTLLFVPIAVLAMLLAIAVPNITRGRAVALEHAAVGNLRALSSSLEMYRAVNNRYPARWKDLLRRAPDGGFYAPPGFRFVRDPAVAPVQRYFYRFASRSDIEYTFQAVPEEPGVTGRRSFFLDETGIIRHCLAGPQAGLPDAGDRRVEEAPLPC